jgi:hypothetical protein
VVTLHVFDHDHAIGPGGDGRAGHYFDCLSGRDFKSNCLPGANLAHDLEAQAAVNIGSAAGKAVASGAAKRRLIAVRTDGLGQNQAESVEQGRGLWRVPKIAGQKVSMFADDAAGVREADYPRWSLLVQG